MDAKTLLKKLRLKAVDTPLAEIHPYPNNPRVNDGAVKYVAASIKAFGWLQPIIVDEDGVILAGHTRLKAAAQLGMASAPVCTVRGLTDAQKRAFRIADNRAGELTLFDWDNIASEMEHIGIDLTQFGFEEPKAEPVPSGIDTDGGDMEDRVICPRCGKVVE